MVGGHRGLSDRHDVFINFQQKDRSFYFNGTLQGGSGPAEARLPESAKATFKKVIAVGRPVERVSRLATTLKKS